MYHVRVWVQFVMSHMLQAGGEADAQTESAKRPIADCLEGLVQMLSPLFIQRAYPAGSFLVKQVHIMASCGQLSHYATNTQLLRGTSVLIAKHLLLHCLFQCWTYTNYM